MRTQRDNLKYKFLSLILFLVFSTSQSRALAETFRWHMNSFGASNPYREYFAHYQFTSMLLGQFIYGRNLPVSDDDLERLMRPLFEFNSDLLSSDSIHKNQYFISSSEMLLKISPQDGHLSDCNRNLFSQANKKIEMLLVEMNRRNKLIPLTKSIRENFGPAWLQEISRSELEKKSPDDRASKYRIQGGYDCRDSKIYYEPFQRPYDAASTVLHELDHLFRDKFSTSNDLVVDESLAYALGALSQIDIVQRFQVGTVRKTTLNASRFALNLMMPPFLVIDAVEKIRARKVKGMHSEVDAKMFDRSSAGLMQKLYKNKNGDLCRALKEGFATNGDQGNLAVALLNLVSRFLKKPLSGQSMNVNLSQHMKLFEWLLNTPPAGTREFEIAVMDVIKSLDSKSIQCQARTSSEDVVRPGADGVKTEDTIIRACTQLEHRP